MEIMLDKGSTLPKLDICDFFINQVTWSSELKFCWGYTIILNGMFFSRFFITSIYEILFFF
jgi:hypothetical protein